jgi:hypothetical protein
LGSLLGRPLRGAAIGFVLFLLFAAWMLFAINAWG